MSAAGTSAADAGTTPATEAGGSGAETGTGSTGDDSSTPPDPPAPTDTPIKHVVVIVKENHTFDNYFGTFPGAEGTTPCQTSQGDDPRAARAQQHAARPLPRALVRADRLERRQDGRLARRLRRAAPTTTTSSARSTRRPTSPTTGRTRRKYALGDHFFANVLGPSFPGHTFLLAAQAGWATGNPGIDVTNPYWGCDEASSYTVSVLDHGTCTSKDVAPCFAIPSVPTLLPNAADWKFYGTNFYVLPEIWSMFDAIIRGPQRPGGTTSSTRSTFDSDVQAGKLPAVTWLVDQDLTDEHPQVGGVCQGENWSVGHINTLMQSPLLEEHRHLLHDGRLRRLVRPRAPPRQYGCDAHAALRPRLPAPAHRHQPRTSSRASTRRSPSRRRIPNFILENFKAHAVRSADVDPAAQDKQANDLMDMFDWNQTPLDPLVLQQRSPCPP